MYSQIKHRTKAEMCKQKTKLKQDRRLFLVASSEPAVVFECRSSGKALEQTVGGDGIPNDQKALKGKVNVIQEQIHIFFLFS